MNIIIDFGSYIKLFCLVMLSDVLISALGFGAFMLIKRRVGKVNTNQSKRQK